MKYLCILAVCWGASQALIAQSSADSDARATTILTGLTERLSALQDFTYQFELRIHWPEAEDEVLHGSYQQRNSQYRLDLPDHLYTSDGLSQWIVDKQGEEVQIHDYVAPDGGDLSSPQGLLSIHESPDFAYRLDFEGVSAGRSVQRLEFKPLDPTSEYSKARLTLDSDSEQIEQIELFYKNGVRYNLAIVKVEENGGLADDLFLVRQEDFPGYHIEDLRF